MKSSFKFFLLKNGKVHTIHSVLQAPTYNQNTPYSNAIHFNQSRFVNLSLLLFTINQSKHLIYQAETLNILHCEFKTFPNDIALGLNTPSQWSKSPLQLRKSFQYTFIPKVWLTKFYISNP